MIDLQDQVPYEAHRLNISRAEFILICMTLALAQSLIGKAMEVGDPCSAGSGLRSLSKA